MARKRSGKGKGAAVKAPRSKQKKNKTPPVPVNKSGLAPSMKKPPKLRLEPARKKNIHEGICSITDPFCYHAKNAKLPDGQGGGTLAFQVRAHYSPGGITGATGSITYCGANLPYGFLDATSYAAGNFTMLSVYSNVGGNVANFSAYAQMFRIVSWGIIVRNTLPALTAQGMITISKMSSMPPVSSVEAAMQETGSELTSYPICAGTEISVIGKPSGGSSKMFTAQNTTTTLPGVGWDVIKVEVSNTGVAATTIDIEFYYNVEIQLKEANVGLHQFIRPDAPSAPQTIAASTTVMSKMGSIIEGGAARAGKVVLSHAEDAVEEFLSSGMAWLGL